MYLSARYSINRKVRCSELWHNKIDMSFLILLVLDLLPSLVNLQLLTKSESPSCHLCGQIGSFKHILSSCKSALADSRYRWRHDLNIKEHSRIR